MSEYEDEDVPEPADSADAGTRRVWAIVAVVAVVAFVVLVVSSTRPAAVPVGASGSMGAMSMTGKTGGAMQMSMRDIDGRVVRVPDGRPGVAVFIEARNCAVCVDAVRTAAQAARRTRPAAHLTVISLDSSTSRTDVAAFARRAGSPGASYVIDDRNSSLASMFSAAELGAVVVYNGAGKVVGHPTSAAQIGQELARAAP